LWVRFPQETFGYKGYFQGIFVFLSNELLLAEGHENHWKLPPKGFGTLIRKNQYFIGGIAITDRTVYLA
jgi:hypothetical protein